MKRRVVVTGMGVLAPNGNNVDAFKEAIFSGKSGIGQITRFDAEKFKTKVVGEVKNFDPVDYMPVAVMRKVDRFAQLGIASTQMALMDAKLKGEDSLLSKAAVIIGSGVGGASFHEEMIMAYVDAKDPKKMAASSVPRITPNAVSAYIALENQIKGSNYVISTACSSSANAIGEAFKRVQNGVSDIVITGGTEATITPITIGMYEAMMVLGSSLTKRDSDASRPFDKTRNGFVMAEGSACLVLEELESALNRNANIHAEVIGFASNCGAYHMVAPNPSGEDAQEVMEKAINDADISKEQVGYINAHGTSTKYNDLAETRAIKNLLGRKAYQIPISGIKSMIGHTIGASAAIQAVATCLSLKHGCLAPTINLTNSDPECDLDYIAEGARKKGVNVAITNSFGFGSNNVTIVIRRWGNGE